MAFDSDNPFAPPSRTPAPGSEPGADVPSWAATPSTAPVAPPQPAPASVPQYARPVAPVAPPPAALRVNSTARTSLILGALTPVLTPIAGVAAVALGRKAREAIARTGERGSGLATAGVRLGAGLSVAWIAAVAFIIALNAGSVAG